METSQTWKECFNNWPAAVQRRGLLVTSFGEQIPFSGFVTNPGLLLLERTTPDASGSRFVILPYTEISAIKIIEPLKQPALMALGFQGRSSAK